MSDFPKALVGSPGGNLRRPPEAPATVALVSHSELGSNSTYHVLSVAQELEHLGVKCLVVLPGDSRSRYDNGIELIGYELLLSANEAAVRKIDLIHAWSPREHVRCQVLAMAATFQCPYLVHMEDNEDQLIEDVVKWKGRSGLDDLEDDELAELLGNRRSHPRRYPDFIQGALGYSCLIEPLLKFAPAGRRAIAFWPGYDPAFDMAPTYRDEACRAELGIPPDAFVLFYPGNTHRSNVEEVRELYAGVTLASRWGVPVRLIRTGINHAPLALNRNLDPAAVTIELGFVDRAEVPRLMAAADALVQPGRPGAFNDYRFPSKLPEFLVSGRPTVLPSTNIGRFLRDGEEAVVLQRGGMDDLAGAMLRLWRDPELRLRIGSGGRDFAHEHLTWRKAATALNGLYGELMNPGSAV